MNARLFVLAIIVGLTAGCTSPRILVPYDRSYQYMQYWHVQSGYQGQQVGGGCFSTRYDTAIPFTVAVPCESSGGGTMSAGQGPRSRYSLVQLRPKLVEMTAINQRHCAYSSVVEQRWPSYECQRVVNEIAFLQMEITKEERAVGPQCRFTLVNGRQAQDCSETEYGSWRNKK